jgi:cyclic-di-GMP phosphodiesterase, flagellum assembly factor TipF
MVRLSAVFIAICMILIAASLGTILYLAFGLRGSDAAVVAIAALTGLILVNATTRRTRDRAQWGDQIADLSRGTADLARRIAELEQRLATADTHAAVAAERTQAATEPLAAEIGELGHLVKELADAVAVHERLLANAAVAAGPAPAVTAAPAPAPSVPPLAMPQAQSFAAAVVEPAAPAAPAPEPERAVSGRFKGKTRPEIVALIGQAIEANRVDLYLQPIVTLPQRKVRYYEAVTRLRDEAGELLVPADYLDDAEAGGLMPAIDNLLVFRCVQIVRRLSVKNREVGLFCNIAASTIADEAGFRMISDFLEANRVLAPFIVFEFAQDTLRGMGTREFESLAALAGLGFRFSLDHVGDLRIEPRELAERGFRFVKVPASLLLARATPGSDIHPADFSDLLGRFGVDLIAEKIETEGIVVDLLDYDVRFGQGFLFSPPRPVRGEMLQGVGERVADPAGEAATPPPADKPADTRPMRAAESAEPRPPARAGAIAQLARGIVRRA